LFSLFFVGLIFGGGLVNSAISMICALLTGIYLIYDIKMIMGNEARKIGIDDYMMAALMIYVDIIRIFLEILKIVNALQEKDKKKK